MSGLQMAPSVRHAVHGGDWLSNGVLDPLVEINRQCIDLLCGMAERASRTVPLLGELAALWRRLPDEARMRLARCPFLLVDAGFGDALRWRGLQLGAVRDVSLPQRSGYFDAARSAHLERRILTYGWHLARAQPSVARIALGMSPECVQCIATLSLRDIDALCERQPGWVRPRWESQGLVWRQLLTAAITGEGAAMQQATLRGIQLLGAGLLQPT